MAALNFGPATDESEFFPAGSLLVLGVIILALWQIVPGTASAATGALSQETHPVSVSSVCRGLIATVKSVYLYEGPASITAKVVAGALVASYFVILGARFITGDDITPMGVAVYPRHVFLQGAPPVMSSLFRLLCHWLYVEDLRGRVALESAFYWLIYLPGVFYLVFAFLDGAFVGGSATSTAASSRRGAASAFQVIEGFVTLTFAVLFSVAAAASVAKASSRWVAQFYVPTPLLMATFILLFYRNPVLYTSALGLGDLPFPIEVRWFISVFVALVLAVTPVTRFDLDVFPGMIAGGLLILKDVLDPRTPLGLPIPTLGQLLLGIEAGIYIVSFLFVPFTAREFAIFSELAALLRIPLGGRLSFLRWEALVETPSLWVLLTRHDVTSKFLAKTFLMYAVLLPFVGKRGFGRASCLLGVLASTLMFFAMNSPAWGTPALGFFIHAIAIFRFLMMLPVQAALA